MNRFLLALALAGVSSPAWAQNKPATPAVAAVASPSGIAADVNGDRIPLDDLNRMVDSIKAGDPGLQTGSDTAVKALAEIKVQMLDQLISTRLLAQEARRQKPAIVIAPATVDDALNKLKANFKTDADFQKWLTSDKKTIADVRRAITDELSIRELSTRWAGDITVTDDDIGTYYRAHLEEFTNPETVKASHIMLAINPTSSQADKDTVAKRAQKLIEQARKKGTDFALLAKTNSDDVTSRDAGGDMGTFARGEMIQVIEDACFAGKVGDIVGPVKTDFGLHIIRIDAKNPSSVVPLKDVQSSAQLKALLLKQKVQARIDEGIAKLRATAVIKKYV